MRQFRALSIIACCALLIPGSLAAQARHINPELGRLMGRVRVQIRARGVDSTQWFEGRVMYAADGCTHLQVLDGRWVRGRLRPDSTVPAAQRISVPLEHVRRIVAVPHGASPESLEGGTEVPLDTLLQGEPPQCRLQKGEEGRGKREE